MVHSSTSAASDEIADVVVVGSGFGASVAAFRLAEAGRSVVVLERGRRYAPGDFARSPSEMARAFWDPSARRYGLFDAWTFRGLEGIVSSGLGGGSLIYANVMLRKTCLAVPGEEADAELFAAGLSLPGSITPLKRGEVPCAGRELGGRCL